MKYLGMKDFFTSIYYNWSLKRKVILSFSIVTLLSIFISGLSSYSIARNYMYKQEKKLIIEKVNQLNYTIDYFLESYMNKSHAIFNNTKLQELLTSQYNNLSEVTEGQDEINQLLIEYISDFRYYKAKNTSYYGGTIETRLYAENNTLTQYGGSVYPYEDIIDEEWYGNLSKPNTMFSWHKTEMDDVEYIVINRKLLDFESHREIAIIQILIPTIRLKNVIDINMSQDITNFLFMDNAYDELIYKGDQSVKDFMKEMVMGFEEEHSGQVTIHNKKYMYAYSESTTTDWSLLCLTPINYYTKRIELIKYNTLLIAVVSILVSIVFVSFLVQLLMNRRIKKLMHKIMNIKEENMDVTHSIKGKDEIGQLDQQFNAMMERINNLIEKNYIYTQKISEIKFELLQEQINPHLLYNTLIALAYTSKEDHIKKITNHMIRFYKGILNKGQMTCKIKSEFHMIDDYISIMKFVYRLNIQSIIELDDGIEDYYTIKLFLQPIVENAVIHGIRPRGFGTIYISGEMIGENLRFIVSDDGIGMPQEKLEYLNNSILTGKSDSYGLSNVIRRMKLFFDGDCNFKMMSNENEGTTVEIIMKKVIQQEGKMNEYS